MPANNHKTHLSVWMVTLEDIQTCAWGNLLLLNKGVPFACFFLVCFRVLELSCCGLCTLIQNKLTREQVQQLKLVILALRWQRQKDQEFKAMLCYGSKFEDSLEGGGGQSTNGTPVY